MSQLQIDCCEYENSACCREGSEEAMSFGIVVTHENSMAFLYAIVKAHQIQTYLRWRTSNLFIASTRLKTAVWAYRKQTKLFLAQRFILETNDTCRSVIVVVSVVIAFACCLCNRSSGAWGLNETRKKGEDAYNHDYLAFRGFFCINAIMCYGYVMLCVLI